MIQSPKINLLYVDDELINLELFRLTFKLDFNVITAESGFNGLEILKANPEINIVISDMKMPGMNGLEFISIAKNQYNNIPYFILTGYEITDEISDAINTNLINNYFQKPFDKKELLEGIQNVV